MWQELIRTISRAASSDTWLPWVTSLLLVRRGKDIVTDSPIKRRTDVSQEKLRLDIHHSP